MFFVVKLQFGAKRQESGLRKPSDWGTFSTSIRAKPLNRDSSIERLSLGWGKVPYCLIDKSQFLSKFSSSISQTNR